MIRLTSCAIHAVQTSAVAPGFVATNFNQYRGTGAVQEVGAWLVNCTMIGTDGTTAKLLSEETNPETGEIL